jgi:DNA/RNA-binding domain of Phe-tRNA-synthetase-like protein
MNVLRIEPAIFERFPGLALGVVAARGIDNTGQPEALAAALRRAEAGVVATIDPGKLAEHPRITPWREAYRAFGAKPKDYPSSIENLLRRVAKGHVLPAINPLVDLYNGVSLRHLLPIGGEDLDQVSGDVVLRFAGEFEPPVVLLGDAEAKPPKPGEVIYADDVGAICRRFNWREADRTKLTAATRNAVLMIEALPPVSRDELANALAELADGVREHTGGTVTTVVLESTNPRYDLGG